MAPLLAGQKLTADLLNSVLPADEWVTYAPTWGSSGTQPVLGNGSLTAQYYVTRKLLQVRGLLFVGSTTTLGTGFYSITTPLPINTTLINGNAVNGICFLRDVSASADYFFLPVASSSTTMQFRQIGVGTNIVWSNTTPVAVANGDFLGFAYAMPLA